MVLHLLAAALLAAQPAPGTLAIVGATVIPMTDGTPARSGQVILVRGERIVAVGSARSVRVPRGARVIDARGRWVMPGLIDAHVHMSGPDAEVERDLPLYLANSVTTVRNMRGSPTHVALRESVRRGDLAGPTILTTGPYVESLPDSVPAERVVSDARAAGYDFLKVHDASVPLERYLALARAARTQGMPLVGHVPKAVGLYTAVREGQRTLEHAEDLMQVFFDRQLDTTRLASLAAVLREPPPGGPRPCVVPTLVVFDYVVKNTADAPTLATLLARPELRYVRPDLRERWSPARNGYVRNVLARPAEQPAMISRNAEQFAFMKRLTRALRDGGVPLALGTDAGVPYTLPGFSAIEELALLIQAGLTPDEALGSATRTAAECLGLGDETGRVAPGLRADLVLLDRDPRRAPAALKDPAGVLVRGRWLPRDTLRARLEAVVR